MSAPSKNPQAAAADTVDAALPDWNAFSPARLWRDWIVKSEAQWSDTVSQLLKDERTGEALNRQISEMQLMHRQFSELAQASLAAANLPSRTDLEALDERMGRLEDGLAQLAAAVSQLAQAIAASSSSADKPKAMGKAKPRRDRRPPAP
jgi:chromosome segregation ATPase